MFAQRSIIQTGVQLYHTNFWFAVVPSNVPLRLTLLAVNPIGTGVGTGHAVYRVARETTISWVWCEKAIITLFCVDSLVGGKNGGSPALLQTPKDIDKQGDFR